MDVQESHELCMCALYALTCIPCVQMCMRRCTVQIACLLDSLSTKSSLFRQGVSMDLEVTDAAGEAGEFLSPLPQHPDTSHSVWVLTWVLGNLTWVLISSW